MFQGYLTGLWTHRESCRIVAAGLSLLLVLLLLLAAIITDGSGVVEPGAMQLDNSGQETQMPDLDAKLRRQVSKCVEIGQWKTKGVAGVRTVAFTLRRF